MMAINLVKHIRVFQEETTLITSQGIKKREKEEKGKKGEQNSTLLAPSKVSGALKLNLMSALVLWFTSQCS